MNIFGITIRNELKKHAKYLFVTLNKNRFNFCEDKRTYKCLYTINEQPRKQRDTLFHHEKTPPKHSNSAYQHFVLR